MIGWLIGAGIYLAFSFTVAHVVGRFIDSGLNALEEGHDQNV